MNVELFIARKIYFNKGQEGKSSSPPAVHIAVAGIALGLAVMIMAVAIVIGFKNEVSGKVIGFGSHIQITHFDNNTSYETEPIDYSDALVDTLSRSSGIAHFQRFATKPGIIKTDSIVEGMVLKGVGNEYDLSFLQNNMVEGTIPSFADSIAHNEVLISKYLADRLLLKVGDAFLSYYIQDQVKARRFTIKGIYETGFSDYDKLFVMTDIRHVQRLNEWS
ncbi:MAG: ABC transporter permease, partial [Bacteroidales bacterium]